MREEIQNLARERAAARGREADLPADSLRQGVPRRAVAFLKVRGCRCSGLCMAVSVRRCRETPSPHHPVSSMWGRRAAQQSSQASMDSSRHCTCRRSALAHIVGAFCSHHPCSP